MEMPKSLGTASKEVYSTHYYGPDNPGTTLDVAQNGYSVASVHPPVSFGFKNKSSAPTWGALMDHSITPEIAVLNGNPGYIIRTSGNTKFVPAVDLAYDGSVTLSPVEDVFSLDPEQDRIGRWREVTEQNNSIEYVPKPSGAMGLFEGPEEIPDYNKHSPSMTNVNVPLKGLHGENMDINKVGEYVSRIANLEQDLRNVIYNPERTDYNHETEAFIEFLESKGLGPAREIVGLGVEDLEGAIAATLHNNTNSILIASTNIYQNALAIAQRHGLKGDEAVKLAKTAIWYHELTHNYDRKGGSEKSKEHRVSGLLAEFFGERAGMLEEKLAGFYRAMAKENKDYARTWSKSKIKSLASQYAAEAEEMDLNEEEAKDYVASRLEEEIEKSEKTSEENNAEDSREADSDDADAEESDGEAEAA